MEAVHFFLTPEFIADRSSALVTYPEKPFDDLSNELKENVGEPLLIINDVAPNPDVRLLQNQSTRFAQLSEQPEVIVALGGGSVIDSAKVFSAA